MSASPPPPPLAPLQVLPVSCEEPRKKPPIVTIMGVAAIVIGSISMFASATVGMIALAFMIQTQVTRNFAAVSSTGVYTATGTIQVEPRSVPASAPASGYPAGPRGLNETQRVVVLQVLHGARPLSSEQTQRVDQLLAKAGKDIVTGPITVSESGTLSSGASVANYYLIGSGKLEIYDDRGVFSPSDGAPVRVFKDEDPEPADPLSNALGPKRVEQLVADAQKQSGDKLTPAQIAVLRTTLADPNQDLVTSPTQSLTTTMLPDGTAMFTANGFVQVDPTGAITSSTGIARAGVASFKVRGAASTMTLLDAVLAGGLGIYLLIVGILVLKQHRRSRGMQLAFAWLKIPVAILAAVGWMWTIEDVNAGALTPGWITFWFVMFLAIGLTYPIALLIVLRTRGLREYYQQQVA